MSFTYPKSFLDDMREQGRVASDSGPPSVPGESGMAKKPVRRKKASPERDMQEALFQLCAWHEGEYPVLEGIYANVNGQYRPGQRPEPGLKAGVPDVTLPAAYGGYHGLYLELKAPGKHPRPSQREWIERLRAAGYAVRVVRSVDEAWAVILSYLDSCLPPLAD